MAPEVLAEDQYNGKKADIWSCGVLLYILLTGTLPFARRGDEICNNMVRLQQLFPRILAANYKQPQHVSPTCQHLLGAMLTANPRMRFDTSDILCHPWFLCNLPSGMDTINSSLLQSAVPPGLQSEAELQHLVKEATLPPL